MTAMPKQKHIFILWIFCIHVVNIIISIESKTFIVCIHCSRCSHCYLKRKHQHNIIWCRTKICMFNVQFWMLQASNKAMFCLLMPINNGIWFDERLLSLPQSLWEQTQLTILFNWSWIQVYTLRRLSFDVQRTMFGWPYVELVHCFA